MFLGQLFAKNTKNDQKNFLKNQNLSKNKIAKMGKFGCFQHVLYHNSAIFEDIDLKFCTAIHQPLPSNILHAENFVFKGEMFRKYEILRFFIFFHEIFKI